MPTKRKTANWAAITKPLAPSAKAAFRRLPAAR